MKVFYELNLKVRVPVLPEDAECEAILSAIENDDELQLAAIAAAAARDNKRAEILKQCAEICRTRLQSPDFAE